MAAGVTNGQSLSWLLSDCVVGDSPFSASAKGDKTRQHSRRQGFDKVVFGRTAPPHGEEERPDEAREENRGSGARSSSSLGSEKKEKEEKKKKEQTTTTRLDDDVMFGDVESGTGVSGERRLLICCSSLSGWYLSGCGGPAGAASRQRCDAFN